MTRQHKSDNDGKDVPGIVNALFSVPSILILGQFAAGMIKIPAALLGVFAILCVIYGLHTELKRFPLYPKVFIALSPAVFVLGWLSAFLEVRYSLRIGFVFLFVAAVIVFNFAVNSAYKMRS